MKHIIDCDDPLILCSPPHISDTLDIIKDGLTHPFIRECKGDPEMSCTLCSLRGREDEFVSQVTICAYSRCFDTDGHWKSIDTLLEEL